MAWKIDLTDYLDLYDPCDDCLMRIRVPDAAEGTESSRCPHEQSPDRESCIWDDKKYEQARAFLEKASKELDKILNGSDKNGVGD